MTERLSFRSSDWAPALVRLKASSRDDGTVGMIMRAGARCALLTFAPLPERSRTHIAVLSHTAPVAFRGAVDRWCLIETPLAPLYVYHFAEE
jgi:hypothetical protein